MQKGQVKVQVGVFKAKPAMERTSPAGASRDPNSAYFFFVPSSLN